MTSIHHNYWLIFVYQKPIVNDVTPPCRFINVILYCRQNLYINVVTGHVHILKMNVNIQKQTHLKILQYLWNISIMNIIIIPIVQFFVGYYWFFRIDIQEKIIWIELLSILWISTFTKNIITFLLLFYCLAVRSIWVLNNDMSVFAFAEILTFCGTKLLKYILKCFFFVFLRDFRIYFCLMAIPGGLLVFKCAKSEKINSYNARKIVINRKPTLMINVWIKRPSFPEDLVLNSVK